MKIIYNKIIPFGKRFYAINLFGVLFAKGPCDSVMINHEKIHTAQIKELGYLFFYIIYMIEWIFRVIQFRGYVAAYRNIWVSRKSVGISIKVCNTEKEEFLIHNTSEICTKEFYFSIERFGQGI